MTANLSRIVLYVALRSSHRESPAHMAEVFSKLFCSFALLPTIPPSSVCTTTTCCTQHLHLRLREPSLTLNWLPCRRHLDRIHSLTLHLITSDFDSAFVVPVLALLTHHCSLKFHNYPFVFSPSLVSCPPSPCQRPRWLSDST